MANEEEMGERLRQAGWSEITPGVWCPPTEPAETTVFLTTHEAHRMLGIEKEHPCSSTKGPKETP